MPSLGVTRVAVSLAAALAVLGASQLSTSSRGDTVPRGAVLSASTTASKTNPISLNDSVSGPIVTSHLTIAPGYTTTGTVTITNSGDAAALTLAEANLVNRPSASPTARGTGTGDLGAYLQLRIVDTTSGAVDYPSSGTSGPYLGRNDAGFSTSLCGTQFSGSGNQPCPAWKHAESHTFTFTVTFPLATTGTLNAYQDRYVSVDFVWQAVSVA